MCILVAKNIISYTRLEILVYVALPLFMLHLVYERCRGNNENGRHCFAPEEGSVGDNVSMNSLFNSLERFEQPPPIKKILLYTNDDSVYDKLKPSLINALKLQGVVRVKKEGDMEKQLVNNNYLCGIIWKVNGPNTKVTIRFPSVLRTWPTHLWDTDKLISVPDLPTSYYYDELFMSVMSGITAYLLEPNMADPVPVEQDSPVIIGHQPFLEYAGAKDKYDHVKQVEPELLVLDPITWRREFLMIFYLGLLYIFPYIRLVMHMSCEKTRQQVDLVNIAGSNRYLHYLSWFVTHFFILTLINFMTVFYLKAPLCQNGNVLNCSSFTALLFFFTIWALCGICFCFLIYSLTNNVPTAAFLVAFFCILAFLLYTILPETNLTFCILFHYGFLTGVKKILKLEAVDNAGLQWEDLASFKSDLNSLVKVKGVQWDELSAFKNVNKEAASSSSVNIGQVLAIMVAAAIVCLIIAFIAELICPGRYGMSKLRSRLPPWSCGPYDCCTIIQTNSLRKGQCRKPPLRNFTMNMYDDQITVLLGPPDSGKSTVLNLISRSYSPDYGCVKIFNKDIRSNLKRSNLGLAPQHNALYPNLTVLKHTKFYSGIRRGTWGLKSGRMSMEKYLRALDIWNVRYVKSRNLTKADKKKLAVVNAFCGNPRIVLLDEPTEGLDHCERRLVWDLLRSEKRCRTIVMTTYHVDEADALADRVGILRDGRLVFNGSSVFMRNFYGSGYKLVCSQGVIYQEPRISSLVSKYVPDTAVCTDCRDSEISYNIPQSRCCGIEPLLDALESPDQCENINSIQIGTTPMMEKYVNATAPGCFDANGKCPNVPRGCLLKGWALWLNQWRAMTLKKHYHIRYNCLLFFLLPLLLAMAFAGLLTYHVNNKPTHIPKYHNVAPKKWVTQEKIKLDVDTYPKPCYYALVTRVIDHPLILLVHQLNKKKGCRVEWITDAELMIRPPLNEKHIYALNFIMCNYQSYYSRKWIHSEGAAAAMIAYLAYNQLLDKFCLNLKIPEPPKGDIEFYNHPYPARQDKKDAVAYKAENLESDFFSLMLLFISIFTGFFTAFIIRERVLGYKLMQMVEGINMATFWLSHLLWDWLYLTLFSMVLVALMSFIFKKGFSEAVVAYIIVLIFFNLAWLAFLYLVMQLCKCILFGWLIPIFLTVLMIILYQFGLPEFPFGILYLIPVYTAIAAFNTIGLEEDWHRLCEDKIPSSYRDCGEEESFKIIKTILPYLAILVASAIFYFALLLLLERGLPFRRRRRTDHHYKLSRFDRKNHILLVDNVKARTAGRSVKDVSFGLRCMDVLGLVGERSGTTTLNKVIISQHCLCKGRVYVRGLHVKNKKTRYRAYKCIGYCPQRNCFEPRFTGRENLQIFGLIRGLRCHHALKVTHDLADKLIFRRQLNKRAKWYNVSDKRKLSTSIAVLGTPPLIILDQPTAGLEKAHRRNFLDVLRSVNKSGSAMLLSSNNMEDFPYLCNRLALLRRGQLIAIGPVSGYRNRASRGLILMVKARPHAPIHKLCIYSKNREDQVNLITRYLLANFGSVYLLEEIQGEMLFYIHNPFVPLSKVFCLIDQKRLELSISDFYIKHEEMELSFVTRNFRILR